MTVPAFSATSLYVATIGKDNWSGKLEAPSPDGSDGPFATLERARTEVQKIKRAGGLADGVTVFVRGGTYFVAQTLKFGPEDSGEAKEPVVYRAYKDEKPVLTGVRAITGFELYKEEIVKANVAGQEMKDVYLRQR